jgi:hypothetical protein
MRTTATLAFSKLEDFGRDAGHDDERLQLELESRVADALEQGYQRGFEAGRIEAEAFADQTIGDLKARYESEAISAQLRWHLETGNRLAELLHEQISDVSQTIETAVAGLLRPIIADHLYRKAVQEFHEAVENVLVQGVTIEIRGPEDLVRGVEQRIGDKASYLSAITSDDAQIEVKCSETIVAAHFASWLEKLEERVA